MEPVINVALTRVQGVDPLCVTGLIPTYLPPIFGLPAEYGASGVLQVVQDDGRVLGALDRAWALIDDAAHAWGDQDLLDALHLPGGQWAAHLPGRTAAPSP